MMLRTIKKVLLSCISILGLSFLLWVVLLLNPNFVYSESTDIGNVTVYHNQALEPDTKVIIENAIQLISKSEIYDKEKQFHLCLNDGSIYPELHPFSSGCAYAFLNKSVIYGSDPDFGKNISEFRWAINDYEPRKFNLTYLIAHEFTHNIQYHADPSYSIFSTVGKGGMRLNWKLEGHADYIARGFKNDGELRNKISIYQREESREHTGVPVIRLQDGTIQNLSYFKYALVTQYLMEVENMDFLQITQLDTSLDTLYANMVEWSKSPLYLR